jgi:hypothetical protein
MNPSQLFYLLAAAFLASLLLLWLREGTRFYRTWRGRRIITCPETHTHEAVTVAALSGAVKSLLQPPLRLRDCSRWPERRNCGQECLAQIAETPEDCLVSNLVVRWYQGKPCAYCGQIFGRLDWHEHRPALRDPRGRTVQWHSIPPELLLEVFTTHQPVCWPCHVRESFRREHPELVTDRTH